MPEYERLKITSAANRFQAARQNPPAHGAPCRGPLSLTLFMALVFRADNHYFAVSFVNFAFIAHRLYRRSDFHKKILSFCI